MDRLIKYLDFRIKTYGGITPTSATSSMYYQMGPVRVRVSDHMVYGDNATYCDYNFIVQENGQYIFISNPKSNTDGKMYMKIIEYNGAKEFIKTLHDWSLNFNRISNCSILKDWNRGLSSNENTQDNRITWEEFFTTYFTDKDVRKQQSFYDKIETILYGSVQKGTLNTKFNKMKTVWNNIPITQYISIISKVKEAEK